MEIRDCLGVHATLIADEFIDRCMAAASGEYVKVYLFVQRHREEEITVAMIADALNHTEADVRRALAYWEKCGVLQSSEEPEESAASAAAGEPAKVKRMADTAAGIQTPGQAVSPSADTEKRNAYTPEKMNVLAGDEDFSQLLYIAQKYMNKVFTPLECEKFAYLYDGLRMPAELLEYVVEYCAQNGHTSIRYIETVALNWYEKGLLTVEAAKAYAESFSKNTFAVMKAFGLNDRMPGETEKETINRWFCSYGFTKELVTEACGRTLEAAHTPSFKYADKILSEWKKAGVKTMEDVRRLDEKRTSSRAKKAEASAPQQTKGGRNQFHYAQQRDTDYDALILQQLREQ